MIDVAKQIDAYQIAYVIRDSILSCTADHQNDEIIIKQWLENKTPRNIKDWIAQNFALVFRQDDTDKIAGFILVSEKGAVLLNYVSPDCQNKGIGGKLLERIKVQYRQQGVKELFAESTLTAKPFYLAHGFSVIEDVFENGCLVAHRMVVTL